MKLFLVQHGEAHAKSVDPDRSLTDRGIEDVDRLADFLDKVGVRIERVIHSGKLRALQTATRLADVIAPGVEPEASGLVNPNDNPKAFDWQSGSWDGEALIVGHLPFIARLVSHLVTEDENRTVATYRPGSIVCLEPDEDTRWLINWMIRPELLRPPEQ